MPAVSGHLPEAGIAPVTVDDSDSEIVAARVHLNPVARGVIPCESLIVIV